MILKHKMTLKHKITLMINIMLIIMVVVSIKAIFNQSSNILNDEAETSMNAQLDRANENVTLLLKNIVLETEKLSLNQNVENYFQGDFGQKQSDQFLTDLMELKNKERPVYMDLFLVSKEGTIVSAAMAEAVGIDVSGRSYFKNAVITQATDTSDIILSRADNTQIVITLTPTENGDGEVIGYTGIAIFATYFSDFLEVFEFHDDSEYIIVDSFDKIVSHPDKSLISSEFDNFGLQSFKNESNAEDFIIANIKGAEYIVMERILDFNEWRIISQLQVDEIYSKSRELSYTVFQIGVVFVIIALGMGVYITDIVSKPIVEITETINRIIEEEENYKTTMINKLPLERLTHRPESNEKNMELEEISNFRKAIHGFKHVLEQGATNFDIEYKQLKLHIDALYHEFDNVNSRNLEFISTLSHDIRTPLTLIKGYARGLESGEVTNEEMKKKFKSGIVKSANDIEHLIYTVLDFAYEVNNSKTFSKETYEVSVFVDHVKFEIEQLYAQIDREIRIEIDESVAFSKKQVHLDLMNMNRVIVNLINNSLKYSEVDREVILKLKMDVDSDMADSVLVEVEDFGIGIRPEEIENITNMFYRTEASKDKKGYGLGLYVSDQILISHGSKLHVDSKLNKGTSVQFNIPVID